MSDIRVAHIITKLELGGAQKVAIHTALHLEKSKYTSILISGVGGILNKTVQDNPDMKVYFIPELIRMINPVKDLLALVRMIQILKKENISLVHTHSSKAGIIGRWAAYFAGVKRIVHTFHGFGFHDFQNPVVKSLFKLSEKITAKITDKLIFVSRANVEKAAENKIGRAEQYVLVRAGIDVKKFSESKLDVAEKKRTLGINPVSPVVGMIACFKKQKNIPDFLKVADLVRKEVSETKFLLVGDGGLRKEIEAGIIRLGLADCFILAGWRDDVDEVIKTFDIMVSTSLWEGLPCTFLEAMSVSKPIVATNVDGVSDVIENGVNGFMVSPGDSHVEKISEYIVKLLRDKELSERMGKQGNLKLKEEFDINRVVKDIEGVYGSISK